MKKFYSNHNFNKKLQNALKDYIKNNSEDAEMPNFLLERYEAFPTVINVPELTLIPNSECKENNNWKDVIVYIIDELIEVDLLNPHKKIFYMVNSFVQCAGEESLYEDPIPEGEFRTTREITVYIPIPVVVPYNPIFTLNKFTKLEQTLYVNQTECVDTIFVNTGPLFFEPNNHKLPILYDFLTDKAYSRCGCNSLSKHKSKTRLLCCF